MASLAKPSGGSSQSPADAERIAEMCRMRSRGMTYQAIGEQFGITKQSAQDNVARAMAKVTREAAEPLRQMELEKLDRLERAALEVLETRHVELYQGTDTGFEDDGPKLAAIDRLVRLSETRRRLLGLDAPEQVEQTVTTVPADLMALVQQARAEGPFAQMAVDQRIADNLPCPACGGDRLRPRFDGPGLCHAGGLISDCTCPGPRSIGMEHMDDCPARPGTRQAEAQG